MKATREIPDLTHPVCVLPVNGEPDLRRFPDARELARFLLDGGVALWIEGCRKELLGPVFPAQIDEDPTLRELRRAMPLNRRLHVFAAVGREVIATAQRRFDDRRVFTVAQRMHRIDALIEIDRMGHGSTMDPACESYIVRTLLKDSRKLLKRRGS